MTYLPNIMKAIGGCPSVSSDCLTPFCVQIKTRVDTSLKSCVQAPKLSEGRDSIPPTHDLPVDGEHKASLITPIFSTVRCCSHIKGLWEAQHSHSLPLNPIAMSHHVGLCQASTGQPKVYKYHLSKEK